MGLRKCQALGLAFSIYAPRGIRRLRAPHSFTPALSAAPRGNREKTPDPLPLRIYFGLREGRLYVHDYQIVPCFVSAGLIFFQGACWNDRFALYRYPGHPSVRRHSYRSQNSQYGSGKKEREPERIRKDADHALPMSRNWDCEDDRRCQKKDAREDSILHYSIGSIKKGWPIGHPLLLPQDYVVDVYLLVRLEAGSLHLANYLIRTTV